MEYSTLDRWQEIGETGIVHDLGSLYNRFHQRTVRYVSFNRCASLAV